MAQEQRSSLDFQCSVSLFYLSCRHDCFSMGPAAALLSCKDSFTWKAPCGLEVSSALVAVLQRELCFISPGHSCSVATIMRPRDQYTFLTLNRALFVIGCKSNISVQALTLMETLTAHVPRSGSSTLPPSFPTYPVSKPLPHVIRTGV